MALISGGTGLEAIEQILVRGPASTAPRRMARGRARRDQGAAVRALFSQHGLSTIRTRRIWRTRARDGGLQLTLKRELFKTSKVCSRPRSGNSPSSSSPRGADHRAENFLKYVDEGFYDGTIFHRVIPGFMIQGGGLTADLKREEDAAPIKNEATNGLKNKRGTLRWRAPTTSTAPRRSSSSTWSTTTSSTTRPAIRLCRVRPRHSGMEVMDAIAAVKTGRKAATRTCRPRPWSSSRHAGSRSRASRQKPRLLPAWSNGPRLSTRKPAEEHAQADQVDVAFAGVVVAEIEIALVLDAQRIAVADVPGAADAEEEFRLCLPVICVCVVMTSLLPCEAAHDSMERASPLNQIAHGIR